MKRTALKRKTPIRGTFCWPQQRAPLRKVSKQKARENREQAKMRVEDLTPWTECEFPGCTAIAVDWHHRKKRSRGGSNARVNRVWMCRGHHELVETHENVAHAMGLSRKSYEPEGGRR